MGFYLVSRLAGRAVAEIAVRMAEYDRHVSLLGVEIVIAEWPQKREPT
jgi:hypothetical protein